MSLLQTIMGSRHFRKHNRFTKTICAALCLTMVFSISGCANKNGKDAGAPLDPSQNGSSTVSATNGSPYFNVQSLDFYEGENIDNIQYVGVVQTKDEWALMIQVASTTDASESQAADNNMYSDIIFTYVVLLYDNLGNQTSQIDLSEVLPTNSYVISMTSKSDGTICFLTSSPGGMGSGMQYDLYSLDASGALSGDPIEISLPEEFYMSQMVMDTAGNLYISGYSGCVVYNSEGELLYKIEDPLMQLQGNIFLLGDSVYINAYQNDEHKYLLYPFVNDKKALGDPIDVTEQVDYVHGAVLSSDSTSLYVTSTEGIKSLDLASGDTAQIFLWKNADFVSAGSTNEIVVLSGNTLLCLSTPSGSYASLEVFLFTRDENSLNAEKKVLTVAGLGISYDIVLQTAIVNFNQSNSEYRVEMKDYAQEIEYASNPTENDVAAAMTQMISQINLDILSGKGPDIIYGNYTMPLDAYEDNGVLVDLNTYIDKDTEFKKEDCLENIISLAETDGHLYKIPAGFFIRGLFGRQSIIGDRSGWTLDEFETMADSLPDSVLPLSGSSSWSNILKESLTTSLGTFVDESTGQVNFDVDSFYQILDHAKTYGCKDDYSDQPMQDPYELMRSGDLALLLSQIYTPQSYVEQESWVGEPISIVGYPSPDKNGPAFYMSTLLGISTQSKYPDASWEFVKVFFGEEVQKAIADRRCICVLKTQFEAQIDAAVHPEGDPEYVDFMGEAMDPMTEEQVQAYRDLVNGLDTIAHQDPEIMAIILEEAPAYFYDQKSAEDVAALIQNRVQTLVDERG